MYILLNAMNVLHDNCYRVTTDNFKHVTEWMLHSQFNYSIYSCNMHGKCNTREFRMQFVHVARQSIADYYPINIYCLLHYSM